MAYRIFFVSALAVLISFSSCTKSEQELAGEQGRTLELQDSNFNTKANLEKFGVALQKSEGIVAQMLSAEARSITASPSEVLRLDSLNSVLMKPLLDASVSFLTSEGVSKDEIISLCGSIDDPSVVLGATLVYAELMDRERQRLRSGTPEPEPELTGYEVVQCVVMAVTGVNTAEFLAARALTKQAIKRFALQVMKKAAIKAGLGPVGTAIAVGVFIGCIQEESSDKVSSTQETASVSSDSVAYPSTGVPIFLDSISNTATIVEVSP